MKLQSFCKAIILALVLALPSTVTAEEMLNINTATAIELAEGMKGVGNSKAEAIVAFREANGPFETVDELTQVKGIGSSTVSKNLDRITVGSSE